MQRRTQRLLCAALLGVTALSTARADNAPQATPPIDVRYVDPHKLELNRPQPPVTERPWFWWVIGGASVAATGLAVGLDVGLGIPHVPIPDAYPQQPVALPLPLRLGGVR